MREEIILDIVVRDTWSGGRRAMSHNRYEGHKPSVKRE